MEDAALLSEMTPVVERLLDRHLDMAKEWFPHELVPWELGPQVQPERPWSEADTTIDESVRSALYVNLLTEDNLPYYFRDIDRTLGRDGAWGEWARRWTAEEGRHAIVIRDYLILTRAVDPIALERARMHQVMTGQVPEPSTVARGFIYLSMQELATRIAHHNTGKRLDDPVGYEVMKRVAADENLHFLFYRDLAAAAFELDPSSAVIGLEQEVKHFAMPGTGILDFAAKARDIAKAGIYDFAVHYEQILVPVVQRYWNLERLTALSSEADRARDRILTFIERVGRAARRVANSRQRPALS
jgi:acyl-[acyl-carrier-protein] desaturase